MSANKETQLNSLRMLDSFPALLQAQQDALMDEPIAFRTFWAGSTNRARSMCPPLLGPWASS